MMMRPTNFISPVSLSSNNQSKKVFNVPDNTAMRGSFDDPIKMHQSPINAQIADNKSENQQTYLSGNIPFKQRAVSVLPVSLREEQNSEDQISSMNKSLGIVRVDKSAMNRTADKENIVTGQDDQCKDSIISNNYSSLNRTENIGKYEKLELISELEETKWKLRNF